MSKNRKVFLLGAGAALDWSNAPRTVDITNAIRKSGFKNAQGEYVTEKIFQCLWKKNEKEKRPEPNFETILSVIEDFLQFWLRDENDWPSGLSFFIDKKDEEWSEFIDLEVNQKLNRSKQSYSIEFPYSSTLSISGSNIKYKTHPNAKYFELLLIDLFQVISAKISDYSFYTEYNEKFYKNEENSEINELVQSYIKTESKNNILRMYSLNYDKIFQVLFEKEDIPIIQGFHTEGNNIISQLNRNGVRAMPKSILFDREKHCIYHLHGNVNWKINTSNKSGLEAYEYRLKGFEDFNDNSANIGLKIEQGKPLFLTNIVTGYQKTQRTSLSPFRQMMSAFDMDCYTADELIIIGYSFGDEHINDIIRQARKVNTDLKIKIVDPGFEVKKSTLELITNWGDLSELSWQNKSDDIIENEKLSIEVYKVGFKDYLKNHALRKEAI